MPLKCTLVSKVDKDAKNVYMLRPDEAKRSAFWLDENDQTEDGNLREIAGPAECVIEAISGEEGPSSSSPSSSSSPPPLPPITVLFCAGGFQMVCNAKRVEVYVNDDTYLTTCRGIPSPVHSKHKHNHQQQDPSAAVVSSSFTPHYYKFLYVIPGGPRPVRNLILKLQGLSSGAPPNDENSVVAARVVMMKLTARIVINNNNADAGIGENGNRHCEGGRVVALAVDPTPPREGSPPPPARVTGPSDADAGSVLAALSVMMRATEERIVQSTCHSLHKGMGGCLASLETQVRDVGTEVQAQLQAQNQILMQQQRLLESQQEKIRELSAQVLELRQLFVMECQQRANEQTKVCVCEFPSPSDHHGSIGK